MFPNIKMLRPGVGPSLAETERKGQEVSLSLRCLVTWRGVVFFCCFLAWLFRRSVFLNHWNIPNFVAFTLCGKIIMSLTLPVYASITPIWFDTTVIFLRNLRFLSFPNSSKLWISWCPWVSPRQERWNPWAKDRRWRAGALARWRAGALAQALRHLSHLLGTWR